MAADVKKMVVGFNHNIKHKGKGYHIQTEDSGLDNPHIITHLFVGGNILASKKTSYADIVGAENLPQVVRELMEEQHKEMLRNLINGVYDDIDAAYSAQAQAFQPGQIHADGKTHQLSPTMTAGPRGAVVTPPPPEAAASAPTPAPSAAPSAAPALAPALAPAPAQPPPLPSARALPPEVVAARQEPTPQLRNDGAETLFGEDLISEKSLDEVILSYLAEDLGDRK